jgi:hypothetical protein
VFEALFHSVQSDACSARPAWPAVERALLRPPLRRLDELTK